MRGKTCLVTGANRGIGRATALGLAETGAHVVLLCRDRGAGESVAADIDRTVGRRATDLLVADLSSQQAIHRAVSDFTSRYDRLEVLVNNAGIYNVRRTVTVDGLESQFAVNHVAVFLLTALLRDTLVRSAPARVVVVSSDAHYRGRIDFDDLQLERRYTGWRAYSQSKLANVLFASELAQRLSGTGVTVNSLHPGVIATRLLGAALRLPRRLHWVMNMLFETPEAGARTSVYVATASEIEGVSGRYFKDSSDRDPSQLARDPQLAKRLWDVSEHLVGIR